MKPSVDRLPQIVNLVKYLAEGEPVYSVQEQDPELLIGSNPKLQQKYPAPEHEQELGQEQNLVIV